MSRPRPRAWDWSGASPGRDRASHVEFGMLRPRWKWVWGPILLATGAVAVLAQTGHTPKSGRTDRPSLAEARVKAAKRGYEALFEPANNGTGVWPSPEVVYLWSRRWLEAELDMADGLASQATAYRDHRD